MAKTPTATDENGEYIVHSYYRHCDTEWESEWDSACNDECPVCETDDIEPYDYDIIYLEEAV